MKRETDVKVYVGIGERRMTIVSDGLCRFGWDAGDAPLPCDVGDYRSEE